MMLTIPGAAGSRSTPGTTAAAVPSAVAAAADARRSELRSAGQAAIHTFANALATMAQAGTAADVKSKAILAIKQVSAVL